jgi:secondary thiamine-phosphate synthase enzyme
MLVHTDYLWFNTKQRQAFIRIIDEVAAIVKTSEVTDGTVLVSAIPIASGVYVNDWEDGLISDFQAWLEKLAPSGRDYQHHRTGEDNADAHLKRTIMGHPVVVPITGRHARSRTVGADLLPGVRRATEETRRHQGDGHPGI